MQQTFSNWRKIPVFSEQWFKLWQKPLLFILNCVPVLGRDLRQALGIPDDYDRAIITKLLPHCFHCYNGVGNRIAVFYSRQPLADSLRKNYADLWKLFHSWDMNYANKYCPAFNVGFDTLTAYPQTGSGGSNITCDGHISYVSATYTNAQNGSGTLSDIGASYNSLFIANALVSTNYYVARAGLTFDTSSITSAGTISSATLNLSYISPGKTSADSDSMYIVSFAPANANTIVEADFANFGTTSYGGGAISSLSTSLTLNSSGLSAISKTSITKFGLRTANDISATQPSGDNEVNTGAVENSNSAYKPYLQITGTFPVGNKGQTII